MEITGWTIPAEQACSVPYETPFLWGGGYALSQSVYVALIHLSLEPGNVLKQTIGEKRLPVLLFK